MKDNKITALTKRLADAKRKVDDKEAKSKAAGQNYNGKIMVDMISGLAVGAFLGYFVDEAFGTFPLMLVILLILGPMVGLYNFYKDYTKELKKENGRTDT